MKRCKSLIALFLALTASGAKAQFSDNFTSPKLSPVWSFGYTNNGVTGPGVYYPSPLPNTEVSSLYTTGNGTYTVTMSQGNPNDPTLTVQPGAPGNWDLRVTVAPDATFSTLAGLLIWKDNNNYVQFVEKDYNGNNYAAAIVSSGGNHPGAAYDNLASYANVGASPVTLHINKTGNVITFSNQEPGGTETVTGTASSTDTEPAKAAIYALLSDLSSQKITLFTDNYYSSAVNTTVAYSNFSTTLPLVTPVTTDPFIGPKLIPTWTFNSEDAANYVVTNGLFVVNNKTYTSNNNPAVTVQANAPTNYDVEVATDTGDFNVAGLNGAEAGLEISTDGNNYFHLYSKSNGNGNSYPNTYMKIGGMQIGNYDNFQQYYPYVGAGPALYRIRKTGTSIALSVTRPGAAELVLGTVTSASADPYSQAAYAFLSDLSGKQIRLYNNGTYTGNGAVIPVAFSKFYTTLPLVLQQSFGDELAGSAFSPTWSFMVPGNNPVNTEDPTNYTVANGFFNVNFTNGGFPYAKNVPSVIVGAGNTGDYWVETAIKVNFAGLTQYPLAGLAVFTDAGNYAQIGEKHNVGAGNNYPVAVDALNGVFNNDLTDYSVVNDNDDVVIRVRKTGGTITLSDLDATQNEHVFRTVTAASTGGDAVLYNLLNNINGKHIGFLADNGGGAVPTPASFDYLRSSLSIPIPATVTGSISLEGVDNLSATNPNAPLGVFDIQIRSQGSLTPLYENKNVTLTPSGTTAFGTYSFAVSGLPAGNPNYDVWIKGSKNLAVLVPNVVITGTTTTVPNVLLLAGDTNNDNKVDPTDFGIFVGAYNTDSAVVNGGYDATADFNFDGVVDPTDFGLFVGNYNSAGAP